MTLLKKIVMDWQGNYRLVAKNEKGITVKFDAPISFGGEESALSPMENVLASIAACSSIHIISLLNEQEQKISGYSVEIQAERKEEPPRTFTKIHIQYIIKGANINEAIVKKAISDTENNYWSVGTMLKKAVPISTSFKIIES
jgi:putative redox protein